MALVDWPTLGELIASNQRAIIFLDFNANQANVPYVLDEFSQMWETPFDPVDRNFPCTVDRPPGLGQKDARDRLFLSNHNLNSQLLISGKEVLVPDTMDLGVTNGVSGAGSLGLAVQNCAGESPLRWRYRMGGRQSVLMSVFSNLGASAEFSAG